jgi:hypothetical protein
MCTFTNFPSWSTLVWHGHARVLIHRRRNGAGITLNEETAAAGRESILSCLAFPFSKHTHTRDVCIQCTHILSWLGFRIVYSWSSLSIFFVLILLFLFLITLHFLSSFFRAAHRDRHHAASDIVAPAGDITTQLLNTFPSVHQSLGFRALTLRQGRDLIWLSII